MELSSQSKIEAQPKTEEKMGLPRAIMTCGFMLILVGIGVGAAAKGDSQWSGPIALAGLGLLGVSFLIFLFKKLTDKLSGASKQQAG